MNVIEEIEAEEAARLTEGKTIPDFSPGDTVCVNVRIREGERERVQRFEGVCIARAGGGLHENFTVRKISFGEGVERVFPVLSPMIDSIEVKRRGRVRRAKLYYLRDRRGKSARIAERTSGHGVETQQTSTSKTERKRQRAADKQTRKETAARERAEKERARAEAQAGEAAEAGTDESES